MEVKKRTLLFKKEYIQSNIIKLKINDHSTNKNSTIQLSKYKITFELNFS